MNTTEFKTWVIWNMGGAYYDAVMNRCPLWVNEDEFNDWFFAEMGL